MNLLIFNLKTDANDDVLGFTTEWINALAVHYNKVFVITMFLGKVDLNKNVFVFSVGKEKGYSKLRMLMTFYHKLHVILMKEQITHCFSHMMPQFVAYGGVFVKVKRIPIVMWYAHKSVTNTLKVAHFLSDCVVTSVEHGFNINSKKKLVIGQGISEDKFLYREHTHKNASFSVFSVGRISRIKRIDYTLRIISEISKRRGRNSIRFVLFGNVISDDDRKYLEEIQQYITKNGLSSNVEFYGSVPYSKISEKISTFDLSVNMSPTGAIDKAALESMAMGIPTIVSNDSFASVFNDAKVNPALFMTDVDSTSNGVELIERWMDANSIDVINVMKPLSASIHNNHGVKRLARIVVDIFRCHEELHTK